MVIKVPTKPGEVPDLKQSDVRETTPSLTRLQTNLDLNNFKIIGMADPTNAQEGATKSYVDTNSALLTGGTFTGGVTLDDGVGDSPTLKLVNASNHEANIICQNTSGDLRITTDTGDIELVPAGGKDVTISTDLVVSGEIGIGMTPTSDLQIQNAVAIPIFRLGDSTTPGASKIQLLTGNATTAWQIASNQFVSGISITPSTAGGGTTFTTPKMVILNGGNVGIGTTTPGQILDVVGNIAVSGTVDGIDIATDVAANTTHTGGDGSDHADVATNTAVKHTQGTDTALGAQAENLDMNTNKIVGVTDPTAAQDAATKAYVDAKVGASRVWSCTGYNFIPTEPDVNDVTYSNGTLVLNGASLRAGADVQLPSGATITGVIVYGNVGTEDESWTLSRLTLSGAALSTMATANFNSEDATITDPIINNSLYGYRLYSSSPMSATDAIYGARITYTI